MALTTDPSYLIFTMRKSLLAIDDALLSRIVSIPDKSDNDFILTSHAATASPNSSANLSPFFRPRERRRRERAVATLAGMLSVSSPHNSSSSNYNSSNDSNPQASDRFSAASVTTTASGATGTTDSSGLPHPPLSDSDTDSLLEGLIWSEVTRVSEARFSWAIPPPQRPQQGNTGVTAAPMAVFANSNQPTAEQLLQLPSRQVERRAVGDATAQHIQRLNRFSGIRKTVTIAEKPNYAAMQAQILSQPPPTEMPSRRFSTEAKSRASVLPAAVPPFPSATVIPRPYTDKLSSNSTSTSSAAFPKVSPQPVSASGSKNRSALTLLLTDQSSATENPFAEEFGILSGKGEAYPIRIKIYIPTSPSPGVPLPITVKRDATVEEVIGYSLYEYFNKLSQDAKQDTAWLEKYLPTDKWDVCCWNLRLVEDDGSIDDDFPALDRVSKMQRSNFEALALCLCTASQVAVNEAARKARPPTTRSKPQAIGGMAGGGVGSTQGAASAAMGAAMASAATSATTAGPPGVPMTITTSGGGIHSTASNHPLPALPFGANAPGGVHVARSSSGGGVGIGNPGMGLTAGSNAPGGALTPGAAFNSSPGGGSQFGGISVSGSGSGGGSGPVPPPRGTQIFIKIHLYSTLEVKQTTTFAFQATATMGEIFETICARRKYESDGYVLKMADTKTDVALDKTLEEMHSVEFCVLKKDRGGAGDIFLRPPGEMTPAVSSDASEYTAEEIATIYRQYIVTQRQLIRQNERVLTLDGEFIHIMSFNDGILVPGLTITYHISNIASCVLVKKPGRHFKLTVARAANGPGPASASTTVDLEATSDAQAADLCARVGSMIQLHSLGTLLPTADH